MMTKTASKGWGGARENAGRMPTTGGAIRRQVTLDAETIAIAREAGQGNVSNGIRAALRAYANFTVAHGQK